MNSPDMGQHQWYLARLYGKDVKLTIAVNIYTQTLRIRGQDVNPIEVKMTPYLKRDENIAKLTWDSLTPFEPKYILPPKHMSFFELLRWWLNEKLKND